MNSHANIESHINKYRKIFILLLVFTVLTVAVSYIHFSIAAVGLFVGLAIAFTKGYLVAAHFMHLNDEKKIIYFILIMSVLFLIVLMSIPLLWDFNSMGVMINDQVKHHAGDHH